MFGLTPHFVSGIIYFTPTMPAFLKQKRTLLIIASLGAVALVVVAGFYILSQTSTTDTTAKKVDTSQATQSSTKANENYSSEVTWQWNGTNWVSNGTAPSCSSPLLTSLPVDINLVTAILYPGQTRGNNYKAHGGFRFGSDNAITVTNLMESSVIEGSRYIEGGEVQYMFTFINPCGIAYRFDHLHTLSEKFQKYADQLPEAKVDDSRTTPFNSPVKIAKGELIATKVGFITTKNVSVDFGVYDLRAPNQASKNSSFANTHENFKQFIFYGVCWLNEYPTEISAKLKSLPGGDSVNGKTSDYCT